MDHYTNQIAQNRFGLFIMVWELFKIFSKKKEKDPIFTCKCNNKRKISEREFYIKRGVNETGTRLICMKCGENHYIGDKKNTPLIIQKGERA